MEQFKPFDYGIRFDALKTNILHLKNNDINIEDRRATCEDSLRILNEISTQITGLSIFK